MYFSQDPQAFLDYTVDWSQWVETSSAGAVDTITTSSWTADPGITQGSSSWTSNSASLFITGGTPGNSYNIYNKIVTSQGRTDLRTINVTIVVGAKDPKFRTLIA